ncbi:MAG TPA: leucine-rich repeat domain-containing protein [bacterium]|nr:leucine-rich repeat domain-containing protein [bacterium]
MKRALIISVMAAAVAFCVACDDGNEAFPDPAFKACIENRLAQYSDIYDTTYNINNEKDLEVVGLLSCSDAGIKSIEGVEKLLNLNDLRLYKNQIESIEPIRDLEKLQDLDLSFNKIKDVEPISDAVKITYLQLSANYITDIRSLKTLVAMGVLYLDDNCISDISSQCETLTTAISGLTIYGEENQMDPQRCQ